MLVLGRKPGQRIVVGDITITVVRIRDRTVRLGIDAPDGTDIVREEVLERDAQGKECVE